MFVEYKIIAGLLGSNFVGNWFVVLQYKTICYIFTANQYAIR